MKEYVVDTNAFLRFLHGDIPAQKRGVEILLKKAKQGEIKLFVPQIVIFELHFILDKYYHLSKEEIINKLKSIVSISYLQVQSKEVFLKALTMYSSSTTSLVDCFLRSTAETRSAFLFTFDKKLRKESH